MRLTTTGGVLHGGVLLALADSLGAVCAFLNVPAGTQTTTISSSTAFARAVHDGASPRSSPVHGV